MIKAKPKGCNSLPSIPLRKNKGQKTRIIITVAKTIEERISTLAS